MKFIQALAMIIAAVVLTNCSKSPQSLVTKGTLVFENLSSNPYRVYVNDQIVLHSQDGNSIKSVQFDCGVCDIKVLQLSGYVVYPTEKTFIGTLQCGGQLKTTFP